MTLEGPEGNALAKGEAAASSQRPPCSPSGGAILLRSPQAASGNQRRRSGELYDGKTGAAPMLFARVYEKKSDDKLFDIAYLDPDRLLPVLIPKAA